MSSVHGDKTIVANSDRVVIDDLGRFIVDYLVGYNISLHIGYCSRPGVSCQKSKVIFPEGYCPQTITI